MFKNKKFISRAWIFVVAAVIIAGSSAGMAFVLNNSVPEGPAGEIAPYATGAAADIQAQTSKAGITAEYTVIDFSKQGLNPEKSNALREKLSLIKDITPQQIEEKYKAIIANMIPGAKDISAEQAAAYAADIVKKVFEVDFTGYTAEARFSRSPVPNSDSWTVVFHETQEPPNAKQYIASVNSINGTMVNASSYTLNFREDDFVVEISRDLENPEWKDKAEQVARRLMPESVVITGSKVVFSAPETGVTVVCNLSDGTAYSVRLAGENKDVSACLYFPDGYDGSLDKKPASENGVG